MISQPVANLHTRGQEEKLSRWDKKETVKVGQEGKLSRWDKKEDCQGGTRRKIVKVGQGRLSRWDKKEDCQGGTRRKTVKVVSRSQTAIWLQLCLYERWSGDYCQFFSTAVVRKCVCSGVCRGGFSIGVLVCAIATVGTGR